MAKSQWVQAIAFSITANTDRYKVLSSSIAVATFSTTEVSANISCERQLTFSKLCVVITTNSKTLSNPTIKFRNNGADTALVTTIPASTTGHFSNTVNTVSIINGDDLNYRFSAGGAGTFAVRRVVTAFTKDAPSSTGINRMMLMYF